MASEVNSRTANGERFVSSVKRVARLAGDFAHDCIGDVRRGASATRAAPNTYRGVGRRAVASRTTAKQRFAPQKLLRAAGRPVKRRAHTRGRGRVSHWLGVRAAVAKF